MRLSESARASVLGLLVVLAVWAAVVLRPAQPVPCVDYVPENVGCLSLLPQR